MVDPAQPRLRLVLASPVAASAPPLRRRPVAASPSRRPRRRLRRFAATTVFACATFIAAFVVADLQLRPPDLTGSLSAPLLPPVAEDAFQPRPPVAPTSASSESRRFAWAPVEGASGYQVELFRDGNLAFAAQTPKPEIRIPAKWRFDRREFRLADLEYRWYVWPIVEGKRSPTAIVQARLVVRDR